MLVSKKTVFLDTSIPIQLELRPYLIVTKPISDEIRKGNQFFAKAATFKGNDRICKMKGNEMY